jgi:nucleotide-binding universal stress UspA family protein
MSEGDGAVPRIVAGVDGSRSSVMALRWAIRQARLTGAVVEAVIAWQYPASTAGYAWAPMMMPGVIDYEEISEKTVAEAISSAANAGSDVKISTIVREGNAAEALIDAAAHADLLVVGSRGHGGFTGALLGSVSQHCVQHAPCPVVVIRGHAEE